MGEDEWGRQEGAPRIVNLGGRFFLILVPILMPSDAFMTLKNILAETDSLVKSIRCEYVTADRYGPGTTTLNRKSRKLLYGNKGQF